MPLLLLEHSFVRVLQFDASSGFPDIRNDESAVETMVSIYRLEGDPHTWAIILHVDVPSANPESGTYLAELTMHGEFRLPPDMQEGEAKQLLGVTGASMLYSAAREYLLLVTGRAPWGPLQLPTISFFPDVSDDAGEIAEPTPQAAEPKRKSRKAGSKVKPRR